MENLEKKIEDLNKELIKMDVCMCAYSEHIAEAVNNNNVIFDRRIKHQKYAIIAIIGYICYKEYKKHKNDKAFRESIDKFKTWCDENIKRNKNNEIITDED